MDRIGKVRAGYMMTWIGGDESDALVILDEEEDQEDQEPNE